MAGKVLIRMGNIFEGGADLTVLPSSAKGTISSSCKRWVEVFGLATPSSMDTKINLGEIGPIHDFPGSSDITRHYCYAASVLNDYSSREALERIGQELGKITTSHDDIRIVETPLLGTGAGRLSNEVAAKALFEGFRASSHSDATLYIFVYDEERVKKLQALLTTGVLSRLWNAVGLKIGFLGLSLDIKKLFGRGN